MKTFFMAALAVLMLSGCVTKRDYNLVKNQADSLQSELTEANQKVAVFEQVAAIIDSIEKTQMHLALNLEREFSYTEYTERIDRIHEFIKKANDRIAALERKTKTEAYHLSGLKKQLEEKTDEIATLKLSVEGYKNLVTQLQGEKGKLNLRVAYQNAELSEQLIKLSEMEMKIEALLQEAQDREAHACFYEAVAWEEVARRTQFAPRRKKESLREALELYERAYELGIKEAEPKIERIRTKLG